MQHSKPATSMDDPDNPAPCSTKPVQDGPRGICFSTVRGIASHRAASATADRTQINNLTCQNSSHFASGPE